MDAVVFDFDGVIARTMEQHAAAYADVLNPLGLDLRPRDVLLREGARSETIIADLLTEGGIHLSLDEIARLGHVKQERFLALGRPQLYAGAASMLEAAWSRDVATAIVTGTRRANLEHLLGPLANRFDALVTQESYRHDKPHPEPYLAATTALNIEPTQCIAVENAPRGVESARAAGYGHVIAIATTLPAEDLTVAGPDTLAADHDSVTAILHDLLAR